MNQKNDSNPYPEVLNLLNVKSTDLEDGRKVSLGVLEKIAAERRGTIGWTALEELSRLSPDLAQALIARNVTKESLADLLHKIMEGGETIRDTVGKGVSLCYRETPSRELQLSILQELGDRYGLTHEEAEQVAGGQISLRELLYPFVLRDELEMDPEFHIQEMVKEPDDDITAGHVTSWLYRKNGQLSHIAIAGHANEPICKQISASLYSAMLEFPGALPDEALLVPGAFLLPISRMESKEFSQSVKDLTAQLSQMQEATGLVAVNQSDSQVYEEEKQSIQNKIERARKSGQPTLIWHQVPEGKGCLVYTPYYRLGETKMTPLQFELPMSIFQSNEFTKLLEAQRLELRHELVRDAQRRKQIYEEWKDRDTAQLHQMGREVFEKLLKDNGFRQAIALGEEYVALLLKDKPENLPEFWMGLPVDVRGMLIARRTQRLRTFLEGKFPKLVSNDAAWSEIVKPLILRDLPVQGRRNYEDATIGDSQDVDYVSRQEVLEWNLPSLIRADEHFIAEMNKLLKKFDEQDPAREKRIDELNLYTLLDAFLRNWPPVFLPNRESRELYKTWSKKVRKGVWLEIYEKLRRLSIRIDPLQGENIVFSIRTAGKQGEILKITPYYLMTDREFMILVHPRLGIPYYINGWQYRQKRMRVLPPQTKRRQEMSLDLCRQGTEKLVAEDVEGAVNLFQQALRLHPANAAIELFEQFWSTTSSQTSSELKDYMDLVQATMEFDSKRKGALQKIDQFINSHPNFIPDPYLLRGYSEVEKHTNVPQLKLEFEQSVERFNSLVSRLKELQTEYNSQAVTLINLQHRSSVLIETLVKTGELVSVGNGKYQARQDINSYFGNNSFGINFYSNGLEELQQLQMEIQMEEELHGDELQMKRNALDQMAKDLEPLHQTNVECRESWMNARSKVWNGISEHLNNDLLTAAALAPEHFQLICKQGMYMPSRAFALHIAPLHNLFKGKEYLKISSRLYQEATAKEKGLVDQLKSAQQKSVLKKLRQLITECRVTEYIEEQEISGLKTLQESLEQFQEVDSLARELMIRHRLEDIQGDYNYRAYRMYDEAASRIPEVTDVRQQLSICQFLFCHYKRSIRSVIGGEEAPLRNGYPGANFSTADVNPMNILSIKIDPQSRTINVQTKHDEYKTVLQFEQLSPELIHHMETEFARPGYLDKLRTSGLVPAYAILLTPIGLPKLARDWRAVLLSLETWLIRIFAYAGIPPTQTDFLETDQTVSHFDKTEVLEQVAIDWEEIKQTFIQKYSVVEVTQE